MVPRTCDPPAPPPTPALGLWCQGERCAVLVGRAQGAEEGSRPSEQGSLTWPGASALGDGIEILELCPAGGDVRKC